MQGGGHQRSNFVLFILALLVTLEVCRVQGCRVGSGSECEKTPFVPGHNLAGEGFDVVRMRRTGAYVINVKGHLVDNHTCTLCPNRFQQGQVKTVKLNLLFSLFHGAFNQSKFPSSNSIHTTLGSFFAPSAHCFSSLCTIPHFL